LVEARDRLLEFFFNLRHEVDPEYILDVIADLGERKRLICLKEAS